MKLLSSGFEVWTGYTRETNRLIAFILPSSSLKEAKEANLGLIYYDNLLCRKFINLKFKKKKKKSKEFDPNRWEKEGWAFSSKGLSKKLLISLRAREKKLWE